MKLGRNVARTFLDYYKLMGFITSKPTSALNPKPGRYNNTRKDMSRANSEPIRPNGDDR